MKTTPSSLLAVCGLLIACGGGNPNVTPVIGIDSPAANSTVNVPASKKVAVTFSTNYTLRAVGGCGGMDTCGHAMLLVDSSNCNQPSLPYNALVVSSPAQADLGLCPMAPGTHTISLELRRDDSSVVKDLFGSAVTASVTINAQQNP